MKPGSTLNHVPSYRMNFQAQLMDIHVTATQISFDVTNDSIAPI